MACASAKAIRQHKVAVEQMDGNHAVLGDVPFERFEYFAALLTLSVTGIGPFRMLRFDMLLDPDQQNHIRTLDHGIQTIEVAHHICSAANSQQTNQRNQQQLPYLLHISVSSVT